MAMTQHNSVMPRTTIYWPRCAKAGLDLAVHWWTTETVLCAVLRIRHSASHIARHRAMAQHSSRCRRPIGGNAQAERNAQAELEGSRAALLLCWPSAGRAESPL